jgi:hypothetical protein
MKEKMYLVQVNVNTFSYIDDIQKYGISNPESVKYKHDGSAKIGK